jgi:hypothetical protein
MCEYLGMKLAERAHANGVRPQSAYRWFRHGTMPDLARRLPSGTILVEARENPPAGRVALYVRVSAHDERADLDRQIARPTARATGQGAVVAEVDCEGWLGHEPPPAGPFGVEHLEAALSVLATESWSPIPARPATTWCGT